MKFQICHFNLKWTLSLPSHLCVGCVCVCGIFLFLFFLGMLCRYGTAHVSKELEVGAFISKSDSVPQQSMEHFASDLLRECGWNWMIACCVTGQVTGGCILKAGNLTYQVHVLCSQFPGIGYPAEIKSSLKIYSNIIIYLCPYQLSFPRNA